ncbi:MAG: phosphoribosylformylglycinamidine cyclo-ligase [Candidatus Omnitrophica bacterium]|nr:phosphoribosylformylglycinamidine cyclo-ligase [Candidatus Omnitrophota bacterium]
MKKVSYRDAGVDIDKAGDLIKKSAGLIDSTRVDGSMDSVGGFGGLFDLRKTGVKDPLLVASTDGVGTKLKLAFLAGKHDTVGIDLVAMCVNDILCCGARPLFFLDYYATGQLSGKAWSGVIKGIVKGCRQAGCALLGGETAEMPGMYGKGDYDLAGFSVGVVDRKKVIDGKDIEPGDVLLGLASTGLHSNGYSLIRKMFSEKELREQKNLFLRPTAVYVKPVTALMDKMKIKGAAHITGGGFYDNIPRMLPEGRGAVIEKDSWKRPRIYGLIDGKRSLEEDEKYRTFNMGIGMVLALSPANAEKAKQLLKEGFKVRSWIIGEITKGRKGVELV